MTKVQVTRSVESKHTVDVEFPLYFTCEDSFDSGGWYNGAYQVQANGLVQSVYEYDDHWEFHTRRLRSGFGSLVIDFSEFLASKYFSPSTREVYAGKVEDAIKALDRLR